MSQQRSKGSKGIKGISQTSKSIRKKLSASKRNEIAAQQKWRCAACRELLEARFELDHKKALWEGGEDCWANLQALHPNCHSHKTKRDCWGYWDTRKEAQTGQSKYFDKYSVYYKPLPPIPESCQQFFNKFRFQKKVKSFRIDRYPRHPRESPRGQPTVPRECEP